MKTDYDILKQKYGEEFAKLCRETFPTILQHPGKLANIITEHFAPTHDLAEILEKPLYFNNFKAYIYNLYQPEKKDDLVKTTLSPEVLMAKAGYTLYPECQTENDIQQFAGYYQPLERLCTFNSNRLATCRVWFAVKNDVDKILRFNFKKPNRQDAYGTSVISIQFSRRNNDNLSIKNRYNHVVSNPDATFANNLDNIIPGLTYAFEKYYGCRDTSYQQTSLDLPGYVMATDRKFYRANSEINNIVFCENNTLILNGLPFTLRTDSQILADNYLIDLKNCQVVNLAGVEVIKNKDQKLLINANTPEAADGFTKSLGNIKKITVNKNELLGGKIITFYNTNNHPITLKINQHSQITGYANQDVMHIEDYFLTYSTELNDLQLPNATSIGFKFLTRNECLKEINLPKVFTIDNQFICNNKKIRKINMPNVTQIGNYFLLNNENVEALDLPNLAVIGSHFMQFNCSLTNLCLPNVREIGDAFLSNNETLTDFDLPKVKILGNHFLYLNKIINKVTLPNTQEIGDHFMENAIYVNEINLPNAVRIGDYFLAQNKELKTLTLPHVSHLGNIFLYRNQKLANLELPKTTTIGRNFLINNTELKAHNLQIPYLQTIDLNDATLKNNPQRNTLLNKINHSIKNNINATQPQPQKLQNFIFKVRKYLQIDQVKEK